MVKYLFRRRDDFVAPEISFDLIIEILTRLPATSLMRFKCVSKLWSCLIRSRYFSNLYLTVASRRPRPLVLYMSLNYETHYDCDSMEVCNNPGKYELLSLTLPSGSSAESSSLEPDLTFPGMGGYMMVSLRGLILYTVCKKACIYNPTTRQSLTLPAIIFSQEEPKNVYYSFGYDPVHDQYKVVCSAVAFSEKITSEYWVFVLEPGGFWKRIECDDDQQTHFPRRQRLCINGVIYYVAGTLTCRRKLYCFDVRSEKFSTIQAPHEVSEFCESIDFINHGGKPALFRYTHIRETGVSDLWFLEDGGKWSRKSLVLKPCQRHLLDDDRYNEVILALIVHGTAQNNEVILALPFSGCLLYYDTIKNDLRRVNIIRATTPDQDEWPGVCVEVMDKWKSIMHLEI
ncbi:putative F-box protein [Raphanus sativus]|uniref:F-box protein At5g62660 n=1 Tax=Raphanus sativus TaxID=3726 RepID=A0A6J0L438_RAPSA|nr:putative F-box protein At5g62660 [Raphanus sativus]KAJ4878554.1 putative F-box protein [Raphanus sativus]